MDNWKKYSLLVKITERMAQKGNILSKMSLQELVYLLQGLFYVHVGYEFELLTYGPYSIELIDDLDYLFSSDILNIEYVQETSYVGSKLTLGSSFKDAIANKKKFSLEYENEIKEIVKLFGTETAWELELKATIVYLLKEEKIERKELTERIMNLKPYFNQEKIKLNFEEIEDLL